MAGMMIVSAFLFGLCFGSFLNVCIWRMPRNESVVTTPSHCPGCNYLIRWYENIPLLSYVALRGRCSHCGEKISPRYFVVELVTGLLFAAAMFFTLFFGLPLPVVGFYCMAILLALGAGIIDAEHGIIPDKLTYPAMVLALVYAGGFPEAVSPGLSPAWALAITALSGAIIGGAMAFFAWAGKLIFGRDALGWGDVKYLTAAAMLVGIPGAVFALLAGSLGGVVFALFCLRGRARKRGELFFGPFLAAGTLLWIFAGQILWWIYLSRVGR